MKAVWRRWHLRWVMKRGLYLWREFKMGCNSHSRKWHRWSNMASQQERRASDWGTKWRVKWGLTLEGLRFSSKHLSPSKVCYREFNGLLNYTIVCIWLRVIWSFHDINPHSVVICVTVLKICSLTEILSLYYN